MDQNNHMSQQDDENAQDAYPVYTPKKARNPLVLLIVMLLFAVVVIGGIVYALTREHKDPNAISLPSYVSKSLDDEQPLSSAMTPENKDAETVNAPVTEDDTREHIDDETRELPASVLEEMDPQKEAPLDFAPSTPAPALDVPEFSPQGFLRQERSVEIVAYTPIHYQKKTPQSEPDAQPAPHAVKPVERVTGDASIVIVIDDMGLNRRNSARVVGLAAPITLAYLPYAEQLPKQTQDAYNKGHELIVHMPMEPDNIARNNPGPNALLSTNSDAENIRRMTHNLGQFTAYMGLNNHMGSKLTANEKALRPIMAEVKSRGLWFLDSKTIGHSVAAQVAGQYGVPYAVRDVFLDNVAQKNAVLAQLRETERVARQKGYAIAIGHPHDATIEALQEWLPQAKAAGFKIVSLSTIIAKRFPNEAVPKYARVKHTPKQETVHETAEKDAIQWEQTPRS